MKRISDNFFEIISWAWLFQLIYGFGDAISPSGLPLVHIRYRNGRCVCIFGKLPSWVLQQIEEILTEHEVVRAVIKQMQNGSFRFSRSIPQEIRQRMRNVIVSR